jgi:hypothetical protein
MKKLLGIVVLGFMLFANSAKAEAPAIWICGYNSNSLLLVKFHSLNFLNRPEFFVARGILSSSVKNEFDALVLKKKKCTSKIEEQDYKALYKRLRNDFKKETDICGGRKTKYGTTWYCQQYLEKWMYTKDLDKLSKKYSNYSLNNLISKTEVLQIAEEEPTEGFIVTTGTQLVAEKEPTQEEKDLEKAKKKLEEEKKKIAEERKKLEEEKRKIAEEKRKKEEEEKNYRNLVKNYGSKCESGWSNLFTGYKIGSPEFDRCLIEKENESDKRLIAQKNKEEQDRRAKLLKENQEKEAKLLEIEKAEKEIAKLTPEEKRAYTCKSTFGFRKGSDKFKDCVFQLYATELELAKLEVEKKLAEAQLEIAKANREAAEARAQAAKAEGLVEKAQLEAANALVEATREQTAQQAAAAKEAKKNALISVLSQRLGTAGSGACKIVSGNLKCY